MTALRVRLLPLCLSLCLSAQAQTGGRHAYAFLDLVPAARVAAMGGSLNAVSDDDVSLALYNPAVLNEQMHRRASLNYVSYLSDIRFGYVAYGLHRPGTGTFSAGVQYVDYGSFTEADEQGNITGEFSAAEYALQFSYGREVIVRRKALQAGVSLKPVLSHLDTYTSVGLLADFGVTYLTDRRDWAFSAVVRNVGAQLKTYAGHHESMPTDVQLGAVRQMQQVPLRLSLVLQHLEETHLREDRQRFNEDTGMMEPVKKTGWEQFGDEAWRHLVFGAEFYPFEGFWLRAGYNPLRREELVFDGKKSTVGLSWGAGLRIRRMVVSYASAKYHLSGATNQLSLLVHFE